MIGKHWGRAELECKQCVSKELLMVTAHTERMDGAKCEGITPRAPKAKEQKRKRMTETLQEFPEKHD